MYELSFFDWQLVQILGLITRNWVTQLENVIPYPAELGDDSFIKRFKKRGYSEL